VTTDPFRLRVLATHPVQYHVPLYRLLAEEPSVDFEVWYLHEVDSSSMVDTGFMRKVEWGIPMLDGYRWRKIRNYSLRPDVGRPLGIINPTVISELGRAAPDAVLIYGHAHMTSWIAAAACRGRGIPYIVRSDALPRDDDENVADRARSLLIRGFLRGASVCLAGGAGNRAFYERFGIPDNKIAISPYSIDNEFFQSRAARSRAERTTRLTRLGLDPEVPTVIFVGKYQAWKRPLDLVEAVNRQAHAANLIMVGDGPLRPEIESALAGRPRSLVRGFADQEELAYLYGLSDIISLPSSRDAWGLVVNEAMSAGVVPVVSAAAGCARDLVDSTCGVVHEVADVQAIAGALDALIASPSQLAHYRAMAQERIRAYSPSASLSTLLQVVRGLK
jgi:glycosyltransferase involved in cell wall biosynthesis